MKKLFSTNPVFLNGGLAVIRIIVGFFIAYHGWEVFDKAIMDEYIVRDVFKGSSSASFMVYMGKSAELIAGFLLAIGLFTRVASLIIAGTFIYISFFMGNGKIWYEDQHPFLFVLLGFVFFFTGPGKFSLDQLIFTRTNQK